jgi:hypothetical protein
MKHSPEGGVRFATSMGATYTPDGRPADISALIQSKEKELTTKRQLFANIIPTGIVATTPNTRIPPCTLQEATTSTPEIAVMCAAFLSTFEF